MKSILLASFILCCTFSSYAQWQPDVRITNDPAISQTSPCNAWNIASTGDTVFIVWFDGRDGNDEIYYKRSIDKGVTWGADTRLTNLPSFSQYPSVSVKGPNVYITWQELTPGNWEIYFKRSTNAGITWSNDTRLTTNDANSWNPSITVSGSNVYLLWHDSRDGNMETYYKRSPDNGISWGSDVNLSNNSGDSWTPSCVTIGSVVQAVWSDNRDGNFEIYSIRSPDGGLSWGSPLRLTNNPGYSGIPSIAASGSVVHLVWQDDRDGNTEAYYKRSTDGGITWNTDTRLTNNTSVTEYISAAVSGSNVHLLWSDNRNGNYEIYYNRSTNAGLTWGTDTRLTDAAGDSRIPTMSVSGTVVHTVWHDERDGNREIYYKRNPTGNSGSLQPPPAPVLFSPPNGSFNQPSTVRFIWNKPQNAVTYRMQLAQDSLFSNLVFNDSTLADSTIIVANLLAYHYYWWRVNAKNPAGTSPYSPIWKFGTFPVGIKQIGFGIPDKFEFYNNYPNPFNPTTTIKFDIPKSSHVQIVVYDMLGRVVDEILNEERKPGSYEVSWDGSRFASGVYFYKIITDEFVETKKMVLIK